MTIRKFVSVSLSFLSLAVMLVPSMLVPFGPIPVLDASPMRAITCSFTGAISNSTCPSPGTHSVGPNPPLQGGVNQTAVSNNDNGGALASAWVYCGNVPVTIYVGGGALPSNRTGVEISIWADGVEILWVYEVINQNGTVYDHDFTQPDYNPYCESGGQYGS